jgi:hypothetical protein
MFLPDSTDLSDGLRRRVRSALALHSSPFASPVSAEAGRDGFAPKTVTAGQWGRA